MIDCSKLPLILVMKVTNDCNLCCKYCYHGTSESKRSCMSIDVVKNILNSIPITKNKVKMIWHGGEPLLQGISFYKEIINLEREYPLNIQNYIQTNGTLLDNQAIDFFIKNNFKIGLSYDGPYNDILRGKSESTLAAIKNLKNRGIRHGIITVMPSSSLQDIDYIYSYYKSLCEDQITLSINTVNNAGSAVSNKLYSTNTDDYYSKYSLLFEKWIYDKDSKFNISTFANYFSNVYGGHNTLCSTSSCLYKILGVSPNGDLFPCGKPYSNDYCLGTVDSNSNLDDYFKTKQYEDIVKKAIVRRSKCKQNCKYYKFCEGGCNYDALNYGSMTDNNYFECQLHKKLIEQTISALQDRHRYDDMNAIIKQIISKSSS